MSKRLPCFPHYSHLDINKYTVIPSALTQSYSLFKTPFST